ncbi:MAG: 7-cyano-7-deazaguanine synthase [Candidatus Omnitrophica bacterium]|nr:7-cyano-7-deazaguanine synthase [Candidatus Omnitrophota bacterium]
MPKKIAADIAALVSGGLDSAGMVHLLVKKYAQVVPVYVRCGLKWEPAEQAALRRWLKSFPSVRVAPLVVLQLPAGDLYEKRHWSRQGKPPARHHPDEAVYLPGRNLLLVTKAAVYCALHGIGRIAVGTLEGNPFPDATAKFWRALERALSAGLGKPVRLAAPLARMNKPDVIRQAPVNLLRDTFSCIHPVRRLHCGRCQKCGERQTAFVRARVHDPTRYAPKRS